MSVGDCIHFTGIQHDRCKAGVRYLAVRFKRAKGPHGLPCLTRQIGGGERPDNCNCYEATSQQLADVEEAEIDQVIADVVAGRCPQCGAECDRMEGGRSTVLTCKEHGFVSRECRQIGEPWEGADDFV